MLITITTPFLLNLLIYLIIFFSYFLKKINTLETKIKKTAFVCLVGKLAVRIAPEQGATNLWKELLSD